MMPKVDPITLSVMRGAFEQVAEEMDVALAASAFSPIIADAWDRASGVFHPETGEVIAQGTTSLPIFIVVMQHTVQNVLARHKASTMREGDMFIVNDPYAGGTHTMDVKFVRPVFHEGKLAAFVANTGHWPDVGGMAPGGFTPSATDVYQEGLRLPPVKICSEGVINQDLVDVMLLNMRVPRDRKGDMAAQIGALEVGAKRIKELFSTYSWELIFACVDELKVRSERLMRAYIEQIPDGKYSFVDYMDNDGVDEERLKIDLVLEVKGDEITFDLSGSNRECRGPFNCPLSSTITGLMIGIKHIFWDVPINAGCFVPFSYVIPEGSLFNPRPPAPVNGTTTETCQRLVGAVLGALATAVPDRVPAGCFGTGSNVGLGGFESERGHYASLFIFGGGYGAHADADGLTNGATLISAARNSSIEILENSVPVLFSKYGIHEGSAGAGRHRGGFGVEAAFTLRGGHCYLTLLGDRAAAGPHGLAGGAAGAPARHEIVVGNKPTRPKFLSKADRVYLSAGDGIVVRTPGGGGYGDEKTRPAELIEQDARDGYRVTSRRDGT